MRLATCDDVRDALPDALAGRLAGEDLRLVATHLAECAGCRAEAEVIGMLRRHAVRAPEGVAERVRAMAGTTRGGWMRGGARAALLAATLTGLLAGGAVIWRRASSAPEMPRQRANNSLAALPPASAPTAAVSTAVSPAAASAGVSSAAASPAAASPAAGGEVDGRSLMQALPGTSEAGPYASGATLDDLSEAQLRVLLKELES